MRSCQLVVWDEVSVVAATRAPMASFVGVRQTTSKDL